jgi:four helix bundle protein
MTYDQQVPGFDHERLRVYQKSIAFVAWAEEARTAIGKTVVAVDHLNRASSSMPANIAMASGKMSARERCQYTDTAYGSALECAACLDVLATKRCLDFSAASEGKAILVEVVSMLVAYRKAAETQVRENGQTYGSSATTAFFSHEKLDVYKRSLDFIVWTEKSSRLHFLSAAAILSLDKSSTGVALNIAEGNGKFSARDRCRFIDHARGAALASAAYLDVECARSPDLVSQIVRGKQLLCEIVRMLVGWRSSLAS